MSGWNGKGNFSAPHDWIKDRNAAIPILASRQNEQDIAFTQGINNCLTKDGQNKAVSNLDLGGYVYKNSGDAKAANDLANLGQIQNNYCNFGIDTGQNNEYIVSFTPVVTSYKAGQIFSFKASHTNSAPAFFMTNNLAKIPIKKFVNQDLEPGDIVEKQIISRLSP